MTATTVVVEAAWRSGALSTAHHAVDLMRPVGAVPGPVTSVASAGCHRLLREGAAVCVTDVEEVIELLPAAAWQDVGAPGLVGADDTSWLSPVCLQVHDALSQRTGTREDDVAARAGVNGAAVRSALGLLELAGLAVRKGDGWRAVRPAHGG